MIRFYPKPKYPKIIEPFAGSARYALEYYDREVILMDRYDKIVRVWKFLQKCSKNDILSLPILKEGQSLDDKQFKSLTHDEKALLGFLVNFSTSSGAKTVTKFVDDTGPALQIVADHVHKIKHWTILEGTYYELENQEATWYIDPPYMYGGQYYVHNNKTMNYSYLSKWCQARLGQVMVCENTKANWMKFKPLVNNPSSITGNKTTEALWTNLPWNPKSEQLSMF